MTKRPNRKRAGAHWRLLVHDMVGRNSNGMSHRVFSHQVDADRAFPTPHADNLVMPGTEFDELVVGSWLHVEQMGDLDYWMSIGGLTVNVTCNPDGTPKRVTYEVDEPIEGVTYR